MGVLVQNYSLKKKKFTSVLNFDRWIYWKVAFQAATSAGSHLRIESVLFFSVLMNLTYILYCNVAWYTLSTGRIVETFAVDLLVIIWQRSADTTEPAF